MNKLTLQRFDEIENLLPRFKSECGKQIEDVEEFVFENEELSEAELNELDPSYF